LKHALYQIDAFASRPFEGNPAAVIPLTEWLSDSVMQSIASENNLSETAFFVPADDGYAIRWFTPVDEVDLCGHATLASAHVLFSELSHPGDRIRFSSRSGPLSVTRNGDCLTLDFPAQPPSPINPPDRLLEGLGLAPSECLAREDYLAVFRSEHEVASLAPDAGLLASLDRRGVIATAPSDRFDFVCRFFAPALGVPEDPVTGATA
jgi:PhzF family phenazine biosynthesis protein